MYSATFRGEASKNATGQNLTPSFASFTPTAGSTLVALVWIAGSWGAVGETWSNLAGAGNTGWTQVLLGQSGPGTWAAYILEGASAVATQPQLDISPGGSKDYPSIVIVELTGLTASPYLTGVTQQQTAPGTGSDDITSGLTGTLSARPAAVLGFIFQLASVDTPSTGTGFTSLGTAWDYEGAGAISLRVEHKRVTSTAAVAATGGQASNQDTQAMVLVFWEDNALFNDAGVGTDANPVGGAWSTSPGFNPLQRLDDVLIGTASGANNGAYINAPSFPSDQWIEFKWANGSDPGAGCGGMLRVADNGGGQTNAYLFQWFPSNNIHIARWDGGSYTALATGTHSFSVGDVGYFEAVGSVLTAKINGSTVLTYDTASDSPKYTTGQPGLYNFADFTTGISYVSAGDFGSAAAAKAAFYYYAGGPH